MRNVLNVMLLLLLAAGCGYPGHHFTATSGQSKAQQEADDAACFNEARSTLKQVALGLGMLSVMWPFTDEERQKYDACMTARGYERGR